MTNEEFKTALIHIKRHIYSKPIKKYIEGILRGMESNYKPVARLYQVTYSLPLYAQEKGVYYDIKS
jgi:hypothetical protein